MQRERPRRLPILVLAGLAAAAGGPSAAQDMPDFGERVEVAIVNVDVTVADRDGRSVRGLAAKDFAVAVDGQPVAITNFDALAEELAAGAQGSPPPDVPSAPAVAAPAATPATGLQLVVAVDDLNLEPHQRKRAFDRLRGFLSKSLRPADRVLLATLDRDGAHIRATAREELEATLTGLERRRSPGLDRSIAHRQTIHAMRDAIDLHGCEEGFPIASQLAAAQTSNEEQAGRATLAALGELVQSLAGLPGPKALLWLSDGFAQVPGEDLAMLLAEWCGGPPPTPQVGLAAPLAALAARANAGRVTFFSLEASGLQGTTGASVEFAQNSVSLAVDQARRVNVQNSLFALAADTGGRAVLNANDAAPDLERIAAELRTRYSLGIAAAGRGDGRVHRIEVRVLRPGVFVQYRKSYRDEPLAERLIERVLAGLLYGARENPLAARLEAGAPRAAARGGVVVTVTLRVPFSSLVLLDSSGERHGALELALGVRDEATQRTAPPRVLRVPVRVAGPAAGEFAHALELRLSPGRQTVAVAVRDAITGTTSVIAIALAIPEHVG